MSDWATNSSIRSVKSAMLSATRDAGGHATAGGFNAFGTCAARARLQEWRRSGSSSDEVLSVSRREQVRAALWSCPASGVGAERSPEEPLNTVDGGVDVAPVETRPCVGVD